LKASHIEAFIQTREASRTVLSMTAPRTVAYDVVHTQGPVFDIRDSTLADLAAARPTFLIVDQTLWSTYGEDIERYASLHLGRLGILRVSGLESDKTIDGVLAICSAALDLNVPRNGVFVAVGGGVVLDMVGFAASIYRRGIAYLRVPTTLIGMIDAGVGIKQGVNFRHKKNFLGSFYPPIGTINDISFLYNLPRRHLVCGIAEALKIGLIGDEELVTLLERYGARLLESGFHMPKGKGTEVIVRAESAMMNQLAPNLYEHELRRLVDFGHTFSPVIETMSDYTVPHGEAVALDMLLSTALSANRQLCDPNLVSRLIRFYQKIGLATTHSSMSPLLMERAMGDARAHRAGTLYLVVPTQIGQGTFLQHVGHDEIASALNLIANAPRTPRR
jgi:3-dehydroquinate synthetase